MKYFRIIHTDLNGNIIPSALHNQYIITAKNIGLVNFFQIDSFPTILRPLQLLASDPNLGLISITNEMIYDYSVGDEFQFNNYHFKFTQFPGNYNYYEKFSIQNKTITPDSIIYQAARYKFDHDSLVFISDTVFLKYFRFDTIAVVPYESFVNIKSEFYLNSYCGINLWTYHTYGSIGLSYCATENCWGPMDTNGPTPQGYTTYIAGIGEINYSLQWNMPFTQTEITSKTLVYFKKDGITCGSPVYAGIPEIGNIRQLKIYPNPSADYVQIESAHPVNQIQIFNYDGQLIESGDGMTQGQIIRLEGLEPGVYFIRAEMSSGLFLQEKFIIIR